MCRYFDGRHIFVVTFVVLCGWRIVAGYVWWVRYMLYTHSYINIYIWSDGRLCVTFAFHSPCNDEENGKVVLYNFLYIFDEKLFEEERVRTNFARSAVVFVLYLIRELRLLIYFANEWLILHNLFLFLLHFFFVNRHDNEVDTV